MQLVFEDMLSHFQDGDVFDVRTVFCRSGDGIRLLRMVAVTPENSQEGQTSLSDYGEYIFFQRHMTGTEFTSLLRALDSGDVVPFEITGVCSEVFCSWSLKEAQYEFQKLARGQWYGFQRRNHPARFYQSYQDVENASSHNQNNELNAPGLPFFPSLEQAETYYLFGSVLETSNPTRRVLQVVIDDKRAWIEQIVVTDTGLQLSISGADAERCEVKLLGKRPGLVRVLPAMEAVERGIAVENLPTELNVYLSLDDEIVDQRFISEQASLYAPTQGVSYERDERVSIEGIIRLRGEGMHHDYKETFTPKILDTVCAFANTEGGSIIIGVDDNGNVLGVENPDHLRLQIENFLEDKAVGTIVRRYYFHILPDIEGREVCIVQLQVEAAPTRPVAIRERDKEKYYVRRDGSNRPMKREDFVQMINQSVERIRSQQPSLLSNPMMWLR